MKHVTIRAALNDIESIVENVIKQGDSFSIATDDGAAVLVNQEEWNSLLETLYLQSIPGMKESIMEGKETPLGECLDSVGWNIN